MDRAEDALRGLAHCSQYHSQIPFTTPEGRGSFEDQNALLSLSISMILSVYTKAMVQVTDLNSTVSWSCQIPAKFLPWLPFGRNRPMPLCWLYPTLHFWQRSHTYWHILRSTEEWPNFCYFLTAKIQVKTDFRTPDSERKRMRHSKSLLSTLHRWPFCYQCCKPGVCPNTLVTRVS